MARPVVLYDEDCGLCRWTADRLRRWDRRGALTFRSIQDADASGSLAALEPGARYSSWHLIGGDGRISSAGAAIPPVLRMLPGGAPLATLADRFPSFTERAYRFVARHRIRLGAALGQRACSVDPSQARGRAT